MVPGREYCLSFHQEQLLMGAHFMLEGVSEYAIFM